MSNVLITNGQQRKSLSVARSLGRKGIGVVCCETNSINPTRYSKYCKKFFKHPDPNIYTDEFINVVTEGIKSNSCSVLIPTDDDTILAVEKNSNIFSKICKFAIPPQKDFYTAFNKGEMVKIAKKAGAYIPETVFVNDIGMLPEITEHLKFPVVIKPVISSGSRGIRVVSEKEKFIDEYLKTHSTYPYPIIQEYIDGDEKFDVCLIYNKKSQLRASFVQKEIRHYPIKVGPSTVQESVYCPALIEKSLKIMSFFTWVGVVELEYLYDRKNNRMVFMEINPRFWASLELAVVSGVDFPYLYYKIAVEGDCEEVFTYKAGVRVRWLLPGDLLHFIFSPDRFRLNPPFICGRQNNVIDDTFAWNDLLPSLGVIFACFLFFFNKNKRKFIFNR